MEDETYFESTRAEVVEKLPLCKRREHGGGLVFDDDLVVDDHIQADCRQGFAFVVDGDNIFTIYFVPASAKFPFERQRVDMFQETISESIVDMIERADNRLSNLVFE